MFICNNMNSKLVDIKEQLEKKDMLSFNKAVLRFSSYIEEGGIIEDNDKYCLYLLFHENIHLVLDYIHIDINLVESSNALEDSIFSSICKYMRGGYTGQRLNKDMIITQLCKIIEIDVNIDNIIQIREALGKTLYLEYEKLFKIAPDIIQELFDLNKTKLSLSL